MEVSCTVPSTSVGVPAGTFHIAASTRWKNVAKLFKKLKYEKFAHHTNDNENIA